MLFSLATITLLVHVLDALTIWDMLSGSIGHEAQKRAKKNLKLSWGFFKIFQGNYSIQNKFHDTQGEIIPFLSVGTLHFCKVSDWICEMKFCFCKNLFNLKLNW